MLKRMFEIAAWLALTALVFVTVSPIGLRPNDVLLASYDRALAFMMLTSLFVLAYPKRWMVIGLMTIVGAGGVELLQELSPTRHARMSDALAKAGGAALGVVAAWCFNRLRARLSNETIDSP